MKHWKSSSQNNRNKKVLFKSYAPFNDCMSEMENTKNIDVVLPMCNLIEYNDIYWNKSGRL